MRISDWSSDVCSSDLPEFFKEAAFVLVNGHGWLHLFPFQQTGTFVGGNPVDPGEKLRVSPEIVEMIPYPDEDLLHQIIGVFVRNNKTANKIGRASCRERVCEYVSFSVVAVSLKKKKT